MRARTIFAIATLLAGPALAEEAGMALRAKALASAGTAHEAAPRPSAYDEIFVTPQPAAIALRDRCEGAQALCYDAGERRIVIRSARRYMPTAEGLRPESISLRRNRVVLRYSFR